MFTHKSRGENKHHAPATTSAAIQPWYANGNLRWPVVIWAVITIALCTMGIGAVAALVLAIVGMMLVTVYELVKMRHITSKAERKAAWRKDLSLLICATLLLVASLISSAAYGIDQITHQQHAVVAQNEVREAVETTKPTKENEVDSAIAEAEATDPESASDTETLDSLDESGTVSNVDLEVHQQHKYAKEVLATLEIKGRAPKTGYARDQFGPAWSDVDHNGCDTRNDILKRDLTDTTFKSGTHDCVVLTGTLADPYTGGNIAFQRGQKTSKAVQIDHVVALSNAWQTGAQQLTVETRKQLANDPYNLLAVDGPTNQQKSDGDAATWLPSNKGFRCQYVARQIGVKARYGLWVTQAEHDAMDSVLTSCPTQMIPENDGFITQDQETAARKTRADADAAEAAKKKAEAEKKAKEEAARQAEEEARRQAEEAARAQQQQLQQQQLQQHQQDSGSAYYKNCSAVRAAGKAPLYAGQPGYRRHLDRDGDGIACEWH